MVRGVLGKSRTAPEARLISKPVLRYTDALPRNDLQAIRQGVSYSRPMHKAMRVDQRRDMSEGRTFEKDEAPGFDFQITAAPPAEAVLTPDDDQRVDESMIGIALGSPRLLESQHLATQAQRIPIPSTNHENVHHSASLQRKPSKWRRIGGLFKTKAATTPTTNKSFYQVRSQIGGPSQGSSHSIDYSSRGEGGSRPSPIENTEVWPCLAAEQEAIARQQDSSKPETPGSLLQVEIPKVEMERYSVMFGGLLDQNRPSLLNRRSKTLENVTVPGKEISSPLGPPRRRATSPTRSRSPNLGLFPMPPPTNKDPKILGTHNVPHIPDPLRKPHPSPDERVLGDPYLEGTQSEDSLHTTTAQSPVNRIPYRPQDSVTSFVSSTSIVSHDEALLIRAVEPGRTLAGMSPPRWDSLNRKAPALTEDLKPPPTKNLSIKTRELRSESASTGSTTSSSPILSPLKDARTGTSISPLSSNPNPSTFPPSPGIDPAEENPIPTIEVSVARSISVSKGKKQILVPVRARTSQHNANERLVPRQAKTPKVTDGQYGHRPGCSQDARIEIA
ncbi:hypothetical protein BJX61DRAFT_452910 [Aspergillus egyptiacus]|nr:hypothetical protein BJX61DRAFT_452910 [Aspergillus egyptiacus]